MLEPAGGRNFGLDVLRCLAIAIVLANHAFIGFFVEAAGTAWTGAKAWLSISTIISVEWLFVLSGFLIGAMMIRSFEREGSGWSRARSFWLRRWFRTLPNYYLFLLVNWLLVATAVRPPELGGEPSWRHWVFAQNLVGRVEYPTFYVEAWSLAMDEWFYLAMPLLVLAALAVLGARRQRAAFVAATLALIAMPTLLRWTLPLPSDYFAWDYGVRRVTIYHLDATGWGVLAAVTSRWWPSFWSTRRAAKAAVGVGCMALALWLMPQPYLGGWAVEAVPRATYALPLTLMAAGTFLAFPAIASLRAAAGPLRAAAETLSNYTYSVYLSHFPILFLLVWLLGGELTPARAWLATLVWVPLTLALSAAVYHGFEKPVSDLRDRFTRRVPAAPFGPVPGARGPSTAAPADASSGGTPAPPTPASRQG